MVSALTSSYNVLSYGKCHLLQISGISHTIIKYVILASKFICYMGAISITIYNRGTRTALTSDLTNFLPVVSIIIIYTME